ncbi:MAG: hypothetical protein IPL79_19945 [Myxococcales bacterium]|nr:hypothetical protein [Myxococcales bacterium]
MMGKGAAKRGEVVAKEGEATNRRTSAPPRLGLPFVSEKAATVLGLKLSGQWTPDHVPDLAARWGCTPEAVGQVATKVDAVLHQLHADNPARRLAIHQLLHALVEVETILDPAKRIPLRVKVVAELSKVTGLVKSGLSFTPSGGLTLDALKGGS